MKIKTQKVKWQSYYGIAGDIILNHNVDEYGSLYLSPIQAQKVRRELGDSGDYYIGLTLPYKGEGCWLPNPN